MESRRFRQAAERVLGLAVMCAERLYWHCRRFFLSDYLLLRGARVVHLISEVEMRGHHMNPLARVEGDGLIYDAADISRL